MGFSSRIVSLTALLIVAVVAQLVMIAADCRQTPLRVAARFAKDYVYLDASMKDYLCESSAEDSELVEQYLYKKHQEASERGLSTNYLRHMFTKLHLKTLPQDTDTSARIHIEGTTRVAINPVFMVVGKWFFIGKNHHVEATLNLAKKDNGWCVCGAPFDLSAAK